MNKMQLQPLKGFRDFYPEQMAFRNWLFDQMKQTAELFGYQQYEGPILEPVDLYVAKSDEELINKQTFILKDKNDKSLAMRPELTPTLARMVTAKENELVFPLRWFAIGPRWRYEQPQKGRFREFWQWDVDLIGEESLQADAEVISIACTLLKNLGLTPKEVVVKINNRVYLQKKLTELKIAEEKIKKLFKVIDRKDKMEAKDWENYLKETVNNEKQEQDIIALLENKNFDNYPELVELFELLKKFGVEDYIEFDPLIVRGLDYYTGTVFEVRDRDNEFRTIIGGGRYNNLLALFGGQKICGVGFAAGDAILEEVLKKFKKLPDLKNNNQILVTIFSPEFFEKSLETTALLRTKSKLNVEIYPNKNTKLEKQLKYADKKGIRFAVIIGADEVKNETLTIKDLLNRQQTSIGLDQSDKLISLLSH